MKPAVRRAVFVTPLGLWVVVTLFGALAAGGITTAAAGSDDPEQRTVRQLAPNLGYLTSSGSHVVRLEPSAIPFCWVCGRESQREVLLLEATHRNGSWLYRTPANDPDLKGYTPERAAQALQLSRVLAFDLATGEKVVAPEGSSIDGKEQILQARGFVADDAHAVTPAMAAQWPVVSMTRGGCVVAQAAFMTFVGLWLAGWGAWWVMTRRRSRALNEI